jgi:hypothetical protein
MRTASRNVVLHGVDEPLAELRLLRAGPLTAALDGVDLRYVKLGEVELVRRIYVAVRDRNWNTIPGVASDITVEQHADSFEIGFGVRHSGHGTDFSWEGSVLGSPDGRITFRMAGRGEREMLYNRIGFCVLHPWRESAGRPFLGQTPHGPVRGTLPLLVGPQRFVQGAYVPLFPSVSELEIELAGGGQAVFEFEGDLFETEDQRNWTDASFKTYCTPLALGFPHKLGPGERRAQAVTVYARGAAPAVAAPRPAAVAVGEPDGARIPAVGLALAAGAPEPSVAEASLLRALAPAHLRCDVHLGDPSWPGELVTAIAAARKLDTALELALFVEPAQGSELDRLREALAGAEIEIARVLVALEGAQTVTPEETTPPELVGMVRARLRLADAPVAGGTDMYFCELNRTRPQVEAMDGVFWSINGQVHAFDDISLLETPEAQGVQVRTARQFAPGKPLFVGPVTLRRRYNVNATVAEDQARGELPDSVDPRQASLIAAAWTLASAKNLAEHGVDAITYFETVGWRGVIQGDGDPPRPERFAAAAGQVFPLFHVLADLTELRGLEVAPCNESLPLESVGLAARRADGTVAAILVANLTPRSLTVELTATVAGSALVRRLNQETAEQAMLEPARFRAAARTETIGELALRPYETVRIDPSTN